MARSHPTTEPSRDLATCLALIRRAAEPVPNPGAPASTASPCNRAALAERDAPTARLPARELLSEHISEQIRRAIHEDR